MKIWIFIMIMLFVASGLAHERNMSDKQKYKTFIGVLVALGMLFAGLKYL